MDGSARKNDIFTFRGAPYFDRSRLSCRPFFFFFIFLKEFRIAEILDMEALLSGFDTAELAIRTAREDYRLSIPYGYYMLLDLCSTVREIVAEGRREAAD